MKRNIRRQRQIDRNSLVHVAGCVYCLRDGFDASLWILAPGTKVPRSLRRFFGFSVSS